MTPLTDRFLKHETAAQAAVPAAAAAPSRTADRQEPVRWRDRLFGVDRATRMHLHMVLAASLLMLTGGLAIIYLGWVGLAPQWLSVWWLVVMLVVNAGFFAAVRFGLTRHLADPALTEPQMVHAILQTTVSYLLAGPARGAFLLAVMLVLTFGLFSLSTPRMWRMVAFAVVSTSAAMFGATTFAPEFFDPQIERANFIVLVISLPAMGMVASRLNRLRERLRRQKHDLAMALQRIELLATRDELTGLVNRRQMNELLAQAHQRSVRSGLGFCVAALDLDNFKRINDGHGHPVGDEVLRVFGREAGAAVRLCDVLARWGGEEFLLLLPDTTAPLARTVADRLRQRTEALRVKIDGGELAFTVSAGVTSHRAGEPVSETIARADAALYAAKTNGRNRVVCG